MHGHNSLNKVNDIIQNYILNTPIKVGSSHCQI